MGGWHSFACGVSTRLTAVHIVLNPWLIWQTSCEFSASSWEIPKYWLVFREAGDTSRYWYPKLWKSLKATLKIVFFFFSFQLIILKSFLNIHRGVNLKSKLLTDQIWDWVVCLFSLNNCHNILSLLGACSRAHLLVWTVPIENQLGTYSQLAYWPACFDLTAREWFILNGSPIESSWRGNGNSSWLAMLHWVYFFSVGSWLDAAANWQTYNEAQASQLKFEPLNVKRMFPEQVFQLA